MFGDFNIPNIDWNSSDLTGQPGMMKEQIYDLMINSYINENTRKEIMLDLVLTNNEFSIDHNEIMENIQFSDHKTINTYMDIAIEKEMMMMMMNL